MPALDHWQREDGFPSYAYFEAVAEALDTAGAAVEHWWREEPWEVNYKLAHTAYAAGHLGSYQELFVSWRCGEGDEPKDADDFTGMGWYWVPYSDRQKACGDFAESFDTLPYLAEPPEVAVAVRGLIRHETGEDL